MKDHGRVDLGQPHLCGDCGQDFGGSYLLCQHAQEESHQPFACICNARFSRPDTLSRHLRANDNGLPRYPCRYCRKRSGKNGFRRRDHLIQHIRGYHKFNPEEKIPDFHSYWNPPLTLTCSHKTCPSYREPSFHCLPRREQERTKPFDNRTEYNKHMRRAHNQTPFPCEVAGCGRVGAGGFITEKALINHHKLKHTDGPAYVSKSDAGTEHCPWPGCDKKFEAKDGRYHVYQHHVTAEQRWMFYS